jgi:hypothetical protein
MLLKEQQLGLSLIEAILSISVFMVLVSGLAGSLVYGHWSTSLAGARNRAVFLADEGLEAVRNIRDSAFVNITDGTHGLEVSGNQWTLSGSSDTTDGYTRSVNISTVSSYIKDITSTVIWDQSEERSGSVSLVTRLTDWVREVITLGDWEVPSEEADLNLSGGNNGRKIQISGNYGFIVRSGGSQDFTVIDISDPANTTYETSLSLSGSLYNLWVEGDYAYVVSSDNSKELMIIDISDPTSPSEVGSYNCSGNRNAFGVFAIGTTVYVTRDSSGSTDELEVIDASTPSSPTSLGSLNLGADGNEIYVSGDYAYIAANDSSDEFMVVDISDPSSMSVDTTLNLSGSDEGETITGFDDRVIIGTEDGYVYLIDVSTPTSPSSIGSTDLDNDVNDISLGNDNDYAFVATDENDAEFVVLDISNPPALQTLSFLDVSGDLNGVAYDSNFDRAFTVGDDSTEVRVFMPQ